MGEWLLDLLTDLNEPQRQAVRHVDGPLLVLAGAGSGKTRVITRRVAYLATRGIAPWHILAITFTNKAAGEMRQRVEALGVARGATLCTFHALCARLLREFASEAGLQSNYTIYDRDDQLKLVKQALAHLDLPKSNFRPSSAHGAISRMKNEMKGPDALSTADGNFHERNLAKLYAEYERRLTANNALDFDDLLIRMARLLRDRPDVLQQLRDRYRYILIDEYQDTNHVQYLLAHGLAMGRENLCATGDPDQSIYGWRGANIRNILEFEEDYPNATVIRLEENYRSTKAILAAASSLIARNRKRKHKDLWTRRDGGENVRVVRLADERAEAQYLAERIAEQREAGRSYADMAVFYRVNSLSRVVEEALLRSGIPYRVARGVEFYNRKEVKDVLAYLKLLANPADDVSCARVINEPARGIGATSLKRMQAHAFATRGSLLDACRAGAEAGLGKAAAGKTLAFARMIDGLAADLDRPVEKIIEDVLDRTGLEKSLGADDEETSQARSNIDELISAAAQFDGADEDTSLAAWLQQVSLVSDTDRFDGDGGGAVTLMTLHAAKGLEFPVVFMIGCEEGLLPFQRGGEGLSFDREKDEAKMEEERRLAFVGMTRAKDDLTLTAATVRMLRGQTNVQAASRFLHEIGEDRVEEEDRSLIATPARSKRRRGGFYADAEERTGIEAMADPFEVDEDVEPAPPEYEYLTEGCRVRHSRFGEGKVLRLRQPWPQTRADIFFDEYGPKTIVLSMANVEVL